MNDNSQLNLLSLTLSDSYLYFSDACQFITCSDMTTQRLLNYLNLCGLFISLASSWFVFYFVSSTFFI